MRGDRSVLLCVVCFIDGNHHHSRELLMMGTVMPQTC